MIINTKGIEVSENVYLNKEGKFLLQITKFEMDGTTSAGDPRFKFTFKGVEVGTKEPVYLHSEQFSAGANALWRVKQLEVAIKAPDVYDLNDEGLSVVNELGNYENMSVDDSISACPVNAISWK